MERYHITLAMVCLFCSCNGQVNPAPDNGKAQQGENLLWQPGWGDHV